MSQIFSEQRRVLVIDDDQKVLELLVDLLAQEGYAVTSARDGGQGLELALSCEPDLVISDVVMPVLGGIELCKQLKRDLRTASIPVLLLSGTRKLQDDHLEGLNAGADDYLDVPFRQEELLVKVARLIERHRVEKHYREIVEQSPDIIYTLTIDGHVRSINAAGARFFGRSCAELVGAHLSELIGVEAANRELQQTRDLNSQTSLLSLYSLPGPDGEIHYLEAVISAQRDHHGRAKEVRAVVRDITEQKRAEQALADSEERHRRLVESSPDAIVVISNKTFAYVNPAAVKLWGASSADDLIGRPILDVVHPDYWRMVSAAVNEVQEGASGPPSEQKHVRLDGEVIDVEVTGIGFTLAGEPAVQALIRDVTERKRARGALRQTEEKLRTVIGNAPLVLFAIDPNGVYTLSEGEGLKALGLRPGEVVGQSCFQLYHHKPAALDLLRRGLAGEACSDVLTFVGRAFETSLSPLTDDRNNIIGVIGVATDVTDRRKAENALRENEKRYRELFENANDIVYTHDLAGNFTSLNRTGEQITGYSWEEAAKMNIAEVVAPEYLDLARQMTADKVQGNTSTVYELEIIVKDGRRVRLEVSTRAIYRDQKPVGIQGIARDLTERKLSEAALRESHAFFHSFMDNSPAVAFMKDADGRYVYVNKPFEDLFGRKLSFLRGKTCFDWLSGKIARETHEHDLNVIFTGEPDEIVELVPTPEGPRHILVIKFPVTDSSGKRFVGGVGVDITARRLAERALSQQARREAISHRISQAIRCSLDSSEVFKTAVRELGIHLDVDRCSLFMKDAKGEHLEMVAEYHVEGVQPPESDFNLADFGGVVETLIETGVATYDDAANDARIAEVYERILKNASVRSIMYVAIRLGDGVPGAFALSTTRDLRNWSDSDVALAKAVANQTGIAIRQAELYQKAEDTSVREALINRLVMTIRASLSLPEVLSTATRELGLALSASRVHFHMFNAQHPISRIEHEFVAPGCSSISDEGLSLHDPVGRHLSVSPKPIVIYDALNYADGPNDFSAHIRTFAQQADLRSQIYCPLIVKGVFRGVLCIHQTDKVRHWTEDEVALVEAVAANIVIGMTQAELFEMVTNAKQEWETTFDAMSDGIFIFDQTGELKRVNRAGAAMESAKPLGIVGRKCCDILRTGADGEGCVVEKAIKSRHPVTIEITPVGLKRPLLVTVEPVFDNKNKIMAVVSTARDLSELREVQAEARQHQSLLTNILESARESIYSVDDDGRFQWCNRATLTALGYSRDELIGQQFIDMVYEGDRELVSKKLDAALNGQPLTYEMRYSSPAGRLRHAQVDYSPLVVDGRRSGVLGISRDITEQKEEREQAARAEKLRALGQLASGVAHDFNNSLAAILGRAQLLRRQTKDEALLRNLEIIQTAAEDAAATVRRIQTFARKMPAKEFEILDVCALLNDAIEITRTRWESEARFRGLEYEVTLESCDARNAYGCASELREVFVNLIVNALDAMPRGGRLLIDCKRDGERLRLRFADNGMGMAEDVRQKIFEPFFTTKGAQGTGLGLSVSYSIIERHEGIISVSSEPGSGTVFTIDMPACEPDSSEIADSSAFESKNSISILVIDDEPSVRETLADMLEAMGHVVASTGSGYEALQKLAAANFDLVFTDLAMPEMDGWETARQIRKRWPDMNIILVTGYGLGAVPPAGGNELIDGIIGKPFDFNQVSRTLKEVRGERSLEPAAT